MLPRFLSDTDRKQQITTLKIFNDNVTEITKNTDYEISFESGRNNLVLRVTLGSDFPNEKPLLTISPLVAHPWVNESGVIIKAPGLLSFTPHSDLGRVVQAIIREFQRNPPKPTLTSRHSKVSIQDGDNKQKCYSSFSKIDYSPHHVTISDNTVLSSSLKLPELNLLSFEELRFIDECVDRQAEFVDDLATMREQRRYLEELELQLKDIAEENLCKEQQLNQAKDAVNRRIEEAVKLTFENERLYSVYLNLSEKYLPRNIQEELSKAAKEAEEEGEKMVESFLHGDLDVDKFLNLFIKSKSLYQLRKTKEEKLAHQLDRFEKEY
ncbi:vacuolar protein sorting-associated protein 37A [Euwallacea fornicatus]|uniref:vacuolar protein sorting-associated protein 37A n=1 Tax=Euwallacea fornicatus TaxID=995702 RepID=UPI00338D39A9